MNKLTRFPICALIFSISISIVSCNSEPSESDFVDATRDLFFETDLTYNYKEAIQYFETNKNLVDGKLFAGENKPATDSERQFVFQKHPVITGSFKGGGVYVIKRGDTDSADFKESIYFDDMEDAGRSLKEIDAKLRPVSNVVSNSDSANIYKKADYAAAENDKIKGVHVEMVADSAGKGGWIHLFVKK